MSSKVSELRRDTLPGPGTSYQGASRSSLGLPFDPTLSDLQHRLSRSDERVRVEFYVNENTFKERLQEYLIKNKKSSFRIRGVKMVLKLFACLLYVIRVMLDDGPDPADCPACNHIGPVKGSKSMYQTIPSFSENKTVISLNTGPINWKGIIWVQRSFIIWLFEAIISILFISEVILLVYLTKKSSLMRTLFSFYFILEIVNNTPFFISIFYPPIRSIFVPTFLHCWLAKQTLEKMFNDVHRAMQQSQSALSQRLTILITTLICLIFTSVCGFQHCQRAGGRNVNLFESLYFVVVTFATVGYGDYKPENMPSQLFMVIMICVALIVLPTQFEQLACTWMERQKLGGNYSVQRAQTEKHVVVCSTTLRTDTVMDFLNEFYAHPLLQDFYVVLLSPCELDTTMKMILQVPMWAQRVIYIQGSALKDSDLTRARVDAAEAVFILAARNYADLGAADEHTILRSWAVRDFAPSVPQYVQIYRPENKIHVVFAEHVVCEDEFKYALLANNCLCPGTSTLVTLLLHTSRGQEGQTSDEEWHRLYGKCSGNEIYHIRLSDSRFFGEYEGKSFTYASFHSHRKYGVALIGVQTDMKGTWPIMLNPGPSYILKASDICFYMNITKEENSAFLLTPNSEVVGSVSARGGTNSACSESRPMMSGGGHTSGYNQQQSTITSGGGTTFMSSNLIKVNSSLSVGGSIEIGLTTCDTTGDESGENLLKADEQDIIRRLSSVSSISTGDCLSVSSKKNSMIEMLGGSPSNRRKSSSIFGSSTDLDSSRKSRRDSSPARIKKVVSDFAAKTKKVMSRKGGIHLEVPRIEFGLPSRDSSPTDVVSARGRRPSIAAVPVMFDDSLDEEDSESKDEKFKEPKEKLCDLTWITPAESSEVVKGFPPVSPYVGVSPTLCYLVKEKKPACCMMLATECEHCTHRNAREYNWTTRCIILAADFASNAIYNFLVPLRAHFHSAKSLQPIIILLETEPTQAFIDAISWFPLVYWMQGSIDSLDDLIKAGINLADSVVVVNKETTNSAEEDYLADCNTIVAVQTMFKMFPSVRIITELSQSSNMRFMQFRAHDTYALSLSKMEKHEREIGSHISYMFRLPFAAGSVFSASMLDTLLYQAFVKDYMITIIRLLLGIDQAPGSGFLSSMKITKDDLWIRTYGRLYQKLCSTTCEIPIGIYRTQGSHTPDATTINLDFVFPVLNERVRYQQLSAEIERQEIGNLVKNRMQDLGCPIEDYDDVSEKRSTISYVIINPSCDLKLEEGDFIYLIRPSPIKSKKTFLTRGNSIRASKASLKRKRSRTGSVTSNSNGANMSHSSVGGQNQQQSSPPSASQPLQPKLSSSSVGENDNRLNCDDLKSIGSSSSRHQSISEERTAEELGDFQLHFPPSINIVPSLHLDSASPDLPSPPSTFSQPHPLLYQNPPPIHPPPPLPYHHRHHYHHTPLGSSPATKLTNQVTLSPSSATSPPQGQIDMAVMVGEGGESVSGNFNPPTTQAQLNHDNLTNCFYISAPT
ncbi:potassium channel subfamily T member 2-like isoform X2 [Panonychus citri]|uniref:potassium channel subfamily T member 2-like isoform X2 n=1 Tax=Panonychus citri TaxID=50023 RepID=UPI002307469A|nr:potassium channel subfamily T member 2-like isoform X2 [Panonychus citri]